MLFRSNPPCVDRDDSDQSKLTLSYPDQLVDALELHGIQLIFVSCSIALMPYLRLALVLRTGGLELAGFPADLLGLPALLFLRLALLLD